MRFKVMRGFGQDDFIPISAEELEKAIYAHITGKTAVFENGSINGSHISAVMPDFHATMGWNYGHKLGPDDWHELRSTGQESKHKLLLANAKEKVQYLMENNQEHLIGKNVEIPMLTQRASGHPSEMDNEISRVVASKRMP